LAYAVTSVLLAEISRVSLASSEPVRLPRSYCPGLPAEIVYSVPLAVELVDVENPAVLNGCVPQHVLVYAVRRYR
jgi:hypothetical protein